MLSGPVVYDQHLDYPQFSLNGDASSNWWQQQVSHTPWDRRFQGLASNANADKPSLRTALASAENRIQKLESALRRSYASAQQMIAPLQTRIQELDAQVQQGAEKELEWNKERERYAHMREQYESILKSHVYDMSKDQALEMLRETQVRLEANKQAHTTERNNLVLVIQAKDKQLAKHSTRIDEERERLAKQRSDLNMVLKGVRKREEALRVRETSAEQNPTPFEHAGLLKVDVGYGCSIKFQKGPNDRQQRRPGRSFSDVSCVEGGVADALHACWQCEVPVRSEWLCCPFCRSDNIVVAKPLVIKGLQSEESASGVFSLGDKEYEDSVNAPFADTCPWCAKPIKHVWETCPSCSAKLRDPNQHVATKVQASLNHSPVEDPAPALQARALPVVLASARVGGSGAKKVCGIGMLVGKSARRMGIDRQSGQHGHGTPTSTIFVLRLVPGSPAARCGQIRVNDLLYRIGSTDVTDSDLHEVFGLMGGIEGSQVSLSLCIPFSVTLAVS
jgi:hypothetical protein